MPCGRRTGRAELVQPNPQLVGRRKLITRPNWSACAENRCTSAARCNKRRDLQQGRQRRGQGERLDPPRTPGECSGNRANRQARERSAGCRIRPTYAVPLAVGISYTMGGIEIDAQARVTAAIGEGSLGSFAAGSLPRQASSDGRSADISRRISPRRWARTDRRQSI